MEGVMMWPDSGLNTASQGSESKEVTQEDMVRVSESMKQAALVGWQIRWDQQKNAQLALFLEFLFGEVKNDHLWELVIALCSKSDSAGFNTILSVQELILIFAPFFSHKFQELGLQHVFPHEVPTVYPITLDNYISYIKDIRSQYPLLQQMDTGVSAQLIVELFMHFGYGSWADDKKKETIEWVKAKLG